ncbi:helix-turn-helix domain-containing protein [Lactococcus hircilactis]|uniref:helix-turn-helix domain-containing protein n=1 Tax=Lactococcus hircilactis TaxID=1494462 RepID=UPI003FA3252C
MIGKKLRKYRDQLDLKGKELATLAGTTQPYLSEIETEKKVPSMEVFLKIVEAIAKNSPFNTENVSQILTEELYEKFCSIVDCSPYSENSNIFSISYGDYWIYKKIELDMSKDVFDSLDEIMRNFFFNSHKTLRIKNLLEVEAKGSIENTYAIGVVRQELYEWWYNHILSDFYSYIDDDEAPMILDSELDIILAIGALQDQDGKFTPAYDRNKTNITKELLGKQIIYFDLMSIKDKNLRLSLDGKFLSAQEIEMLNMSLGAIRYFRQKKE